jgi:hypothetical protein
MAAAFIVLFLTGAVLAWRFRVWVLVPLTILTMVTSGAAEFLHGRGVAASLGIGLVVALSPQLGYAFGLIARQTLAAVRTPLSRQPERKSVARLYRSHALKTVR